MLLFNKFTQRVLIMSQIEPTIPADVFQPNTDCNVSMVDVENVYNAAAGNPTTVNNATEGVFWAALNAFCAFTGISEFYNDGDYEGCEAWAEVKTQSLNNVYLRLVKHVIRVISSTGAFSLSDHGPAFKYAIGDDPDDGEFTGFYENNTLDVAMDLLQDAMLLKQKIHCTQTGVVSVVSVVDEDSASAVDNVYRKWSIYPGMRILRVRPWLATDNHISELNRFIHNIGVSSASFNGNLKYTVYNTGSLGITQLTADLQKLNSKVLTDSDRLAVYTVNVNENGPVVDAAVVIDFYGYAQAKALKAMMPKSEKLNNLKSEVSSWLSLWSGAKDVSAEFVVKANVLNLQPTVNELVDFMKTISFGIMFHKDFTDTHRFGTTFAFEPVEAPYINVVVKLRIY